VPPPAGEALGAIGRAKMQGRSGDVLDHERVDEEQQCLNGWRCYMNMMIINFVYATQ
jgi:ribosome modulation factor